MASFLLKCATATLMTSSGFNYSTCYKAPSNTSTGVVKPHILFIHGFPSSAYDWRHQVNYFADEGYGIIAPDLLGYGGSSKPNAPEVPNAHEDYKAKSIGDSVMEVVDHYTGNQSTVLSVGHDW